MAARVALEDAARAYREGEAMETIERLASPFTREELRDMLNEAIRGPVAAEKRYAYVQYADLEWKVAFNYTQGEHRVLETCDCDFDLTSVQLVNSRYDEKHPRRHEFLDSSADLLRFLDGFVCDELIARLITAYHDGDTWDQTEEDIPW